jgi:hypothetical protein
MQIFFFEIMPCKYFFYLPPFADVAGKITDLKSVSGQRGKSKK